MNNEKHCLVLQKVFFYNQWNWSEAKIGTNFWNTLYISVKTII